jgi:hypothetical protein
MSCAERKTVQIDLGTEKDVERIALSAAKAIHRLIPELRSLRRQTNAQQRELVRRRSHFSLIRDSYRRLATEFATRLQVTDNAATAVQGHSGAGGPTGGRLAVSEPGVSRPI